MGKSDGFYIEEKKGGKAPTSYLLNLLDMKLLICFEGPCSASRP